MSVTDTVEPIEPIEPDDIDTFDDVADQQDRDPADDTDTGEPAQVSALTVEYRPELSVPITTLLQQGIIYADTHAQAWEFLTTGDTSIREYLHHLGLTVLINRDDGYAYLQSLSDQELEEMPGTSRLVPRHRLSKNVSILLALLRKRLIAFDSGDISDTGGRLVLTRGQIQQNMLPFMPAKLDDAQVADKVDALINQVLKLGFLRRVTGDDDSVEVSRAITTFITADWLARFEQEIDFYRDNDRVITEAVDSDDDSDHVELDSPDTTEPTQTEPEENQ